MTVNTYILNHGSCEQSNGKKLSVSLSVDHKTETIVTMKKMKDLSELAAVHEACPAGAAQTAVGDSHLSAVVSRLAAAALYYAAPSTRQRPAYICSYVPEEALERLAAAAAFVHPVADADQSGQTAAPLGFQTGVPAADLLPIFLAHLLPSAFLPLRPEASAADAVVRVCSAAIRVRHPAVQASRPAAVCHPDAVVNHAIYFFAASRAPAAVYLLAAAVDHAALGLDSAAVAAAAVMTLVVAAEPARLVVVVVVVHPLPTGPVPAYSAEATHSQTAAAAASAKTVSAAD